MDDTSRAQAEVLPLIALELIFGLIGSPYGYEMRQALAKRVNTPRAAKSQILGRETSDFDRERRYWVADVVFPEEVFMRFSSEFMGTGVLPSGRRTNLLLPDWEPLIIYFINPTFSWAPEPFRGLNVSMLEITQGMRDKRQITAAQELITMKRRIMAGIMPISERRWAELGLDDDDKFHAACAYICSVIEVFHYLNVPGVKRLMRESYNFVWESMDTFDKALRAAGKATYDSDVSLAGLWHEYIKNYFEFISRRAYRWVTEHVERLRTRIIPQLTDKILPSSNAACVGMDFVLPDRIHDLGMITAQANSDMFIAMDGYRGEDLPSQDHLEPDTSMYRTDPIQFSANTKVRQKDYLARVRYLFRLEKQTDPNARRKSAQELALDQVRAHETARAELRGPQRHDPPEQELWVSKAIDSNPSLLKYKGYRISNDHDDEAWEKFKTKLEEDMSGWGSELVGADEIRAKCTIDWTDARDIVSADEGSSDGLLTILRHFADLETRSVGFRRDVFIVANHVMINSYLDPELHDTRHLLLCETQSSAYARQAADHVEPSALPHAYQGWLRVPGRIFWDDFMPMQLMKVETMSQLWRLNHGDGIYRHPLGPVYKPAKDNVNEDSLFI